MRLILMTGCIYLALHCYRAANLLGDWVLCGLGVVFTVLSFLMAVPIQVKVENGGDTNER